MQNYIPQILVLLALAFGLVEAYFSNGQKIIVSFRREVIWVVIAVALLIWGGFFDYILKVIGIGG